MTIRETQMVRRGTCVIVDVEGPTITSGTPTVPPITALTTPIQLAAGQSDVCVGWMGAPGSTISVEITATTLKYNIILVQL